VGRSPKEGAKGETDHMPYDKVCRESCSTTNSNNAWIRTVFLRVYEEGERDAHDHSPDEDQIEKVCIVSEDVTKAPNNRDGATEVDWDFVTS
jgi:hypothetical protein